MDSGNSGSLQSSSSGGGGDEEYDSRAESISAFLNPTAHIGQMSDPSPQPPPPGHHLHATTTPLFDSLSNYFDPISRPQPPFSSPNSLLNLDMVWSKTLRSDPNYTQINPILASHQTQSHHRPFTSSSPSPTVPFPPVTEVTPSAAATSDQTAHVVRNPKKRSRASRRAPTTVLTTDTTNFRAMVQEFTGVPAPPFTSSSPFPRTRLDLFGTPSSIRSNPSSLPTSQPPYLLRPFAQKLQPPPTSTSLFMTSSSMLDNIASTSTNNNNITFTSPNSATSIASTSTNSQLSSHQLGFLKQSDHQSLILNMQDPSLTFQSLLQSPPKYPLPNSNILGSKTQGSFGIPSNHSNLKMGVLDEFGLGHDHVNSAQLSGHGLPNLVCADGTTAAAATRNDDMDRMRWGCGVDTNDGNQSSHLIRSLNGNYDYSRNVLKGKLNSSSSSASSTDFLGEKGSGNVATTRGEGMMESWICSSD